LKEDFFNIWDETDKQAAWDKYTDWKARIPDDLVKPFKDITTAVENWKEPIFAYFDTPFTNAYTEALNGVMKVVNRNGRGYSFDVIRAKMLYLEAHMYRKRPYRESWQAEKPAAPVVTFTVIREQHELRIRLLEDSENLGVPLSTYDHESSELPDDDDSTTKSE
jgi:hypothetical protein